MTNEKDEANEASTSSSTTESRPAVQARGNAPAATGRNVISYTNRDQQQVTIPVANIQSVDEIVPSGTWDVTQREKDDVLDIPIVILDAIKMNGNNGDFVVVLAVENEDLQKNGQSAELFSLAYSSVPYSKIRRAQGFDEDGREVANNRLPMVCKTVKIPTNTNWYWDLKDPAWIPTATA